MQYNVPAIPPRLVNRTVRANTRALSLSLSWYWQRPLPIHATAASKQARSSAVSESMLQLLGGDTVLQKYRVQGAGLLTLSRKRLGGSDPHITPGTTPDLLTWAL
ncbi:hypothetical protein CGRA01v4_11051 [Colletotrichum graminicola]|nr:hypothetical protein CGRA01v4_11051 [Colletotrichum graminicola]